MDAHANALVAYAKEMEVVVTDTVTFTAEADAEGEEVHFSETGLCDCQSVYLPVCLSVEMANCVS